MLSRAFLFVVSFCLGCYASREAAPDALHPDGGVDFDADVASDADLARDADVDTGRYVPPPDPVIEDPPPPPTGEPLRAVEVVLTDTYACALDDAGRVWCWGMFPPAEIRRTYRSYPNPEPVQITPLPVLTTIGLSDRTICGIDRERRTWCWGLTFTRPIPESYYDMRPLPEPLLSPADSLPSVCSVGDGVVRCPFEHFFLRELEGFEGVTDFVPYRAGDGGGCVLNPSGVLCGGDVPPGAAGDGDRGDGRPEFPSRVEDLGFLEPGGLCALDAEGRVYCWGRLRSYQLGLELSRCEDGGADCAFTPAGPLPVPRLRAISRGHSLCGITLDHELWCWLCEDSRTCLDGPTRIEIEPVSTAFANEWGVCAVTRSGGIRCFALANTILRGDGSPEQRVEDRGNQPTSWVSGFVQE